MSLKLPQELESFSETIESSKTNYIKITAEEKKKLSLTQSKFGGYPFLPKGMKYPISKTRNRPLLLLAQINFKELPQNDIFPKKGILQIYVEDDEFSGRRHHSSEDPWKNYTKQEGFKILYFEDENVEYEQSFAFLKDFEPEYSPFYENEQFELDFKPEEEYVNTRDIRFKDFFSKDSSDFFEQFGKERNIVWDAYAKEATGDGHKMGGYGFFIQFDPREDCKEEHYKDDVLLLQIDSEMESDLNIMWGDAGSAQFLMKKEDLKNLDFSKVLYYWHCH